MGIGLIEDKEVVDMKVALVQMTVTAGDVEGNRRRGVEMARTAAKQAEVVVLPEIWTTGYSLGRVQEWAEDENGPTVSALAAVARATGAMVIAGSIPQKRAGQVFNGVFVINGAGEVVSDYQKLHLCSLYRENSFFAPGMRRSLFSIGGVMAGVAVCYDLRFPELFRTLALDGARVIFVPAEWPTVRGTHWRVLNQARAIENQVFVCAVNCVGRHRDDVFYGHSLVIAPTGEIIAEGPDEKEDIIYCELDPALVDKEQARLKAWRDRRPDMYGC